MKVVQLLGLWGPWWCQLCRDLDFMLKSHIGRAATGKQNSCVYAYRVASVVFNSVTLWTMAHQAFLFEGSPGKNTGVYWPILVPIPFLSTIFPLALAVNSLEYLMLPEPL